MWVVDPSDASVTIHLPRQDPRRLEETDILDGAPLLPGFRLPVVEVFGL